MSIYDAIDARVDERLLEKLLPAIVGIPVLRDFYVTADVRDLLLGPWRNATWEDRGQRLRADIDLFVGGEVVIASFRESEKSCFLKRLLPPTDAVWEFRSRKPKPGIRIFGRFAAVDCFIASVSS